MAWVKSSEGLLGGRVLSRTHFRSSLSPEEGPSCFWFGLPFGSPNLSPRLVTDDDDDDDMI